MSTPVRSNSPVMAFAALPSTSARVWLLASPNEVLVTGTVRDLVAGSGIEFDDRGRTSLRACPASGACSPQDATGHRPADDHCRPNNRLHSRLTQAGDVAADSKMHRCAAQAALDLERCFWKQKVRPIDTRKGRNRF